MKKQKRKTKDEYNPENLIAIALGLPAETVRKKAKVFKHTFARPFKEESLGKVTNIKIDPLTGYLTATMRVKKSKVKQFEELFGVKLKA